MAKKHNVTIPSTMDGKMDTNDEEQYYVFICKKNRIRHMLQIGCKYKMKYESEQMALWLMSPEVKVMPDGNRLSHSAFRHKYFILHRSIATQMEKLHYDILREIFEQTYSLKGGRRALAASARTCRSLQDAALDVLWNKLDSLEPLLCFLALGRKQEDAEDVIGEVLQGSISSCAWSKFTAHARRVRHLVLTEEGQWIHPSIFASVLEKAGDEAVLPCLRSLKWVIDIGSNSGPLSFLPTGLHSIAICCSRYASRTFFRWTETDILQTIKSRCPEVHDITIDLRLKISPKTLSSFNHLRRLSFAHTSKTVEFNSQLIRTTAALGELKTLEAWLSGKIGHDTFPGGPNINSYKTLKILSLCSDNSWCGVASVLAAISSPNLLSLSIKLPATWNPPRLFANVSLEECHVCSRIISLNVLTQRWSNTLQTLILDLRDACMVDGRVTSFPNLLASLYPLQRLEMLAIMVGDVVEDTNSVLRDSDILTMAESWPQLQSLCIDVHEAHNHIAVMSLQSLVTFVSRSTHLQKVELPALLLDTRSTVVSMVHQAHRDTLYDFYELHIHHLLPAELSEVSIHRIAAQLCSCFPKIRMENTTRCEKKWASCKWELMSRAMMLHLHNNPSIM
ncbi:hypothetical protein CERSUDRAFT_123271 [Gelatoporia subvermispora B]|uniref:F-box domain-containing protein n=1 Tax=Ceriporiopsis subvermispora (strain B) TaxID=914234 RepID=M2QYN8_CERS8|nr:hypothetical protein CERSUDRAFT_123271 [Gelatoporia subvermispora B]